MTKALPARQPQPLPPSRASVTWEENGLTEIGGATRVRVGEWIIARSESFVDLYEHR